MNPLRRLALWVFKNESIPLGPIPPHVLLGWALGSKGQRIPVLVLEVRTCTDRCTWGLEYLLPELKVKGRCNSSHGGNCCACGGPLPDVHDHLFAPCSNCERPGARDDQFGGNVCSAACLNRFVGWLEDSPPVWSICLGHGKPPSVFGSYGRHQQHSVKVRRILA